MKKIEILALALTLLTACKKDMNEINPAATLQSDLDSEVKKGELTKTRPFAVNFYTSVDTNSSIPPTPCSGDLPGFANPGYFLHGNIKHMGSINASQSRGQDVSCNLSFTTFLLTTSVEGQIETANGDLIFYTGNDEIDAFNFLTGAGTTGSIIGIWTITGGTGRFEGATGSFPIRGPVDFATGTFSFTGVGTITY